VTCENLNLIAPGYQLCYSLSRYDDRYFFSTTFFPLFLSCIPLLPESPLSTFRSFRIGCDFHVYPYRERALLYLFPWHPNVFRTFLNTSINKKLIFFSEVVTKNNGFQLPRNRLQLCSFFSS